MTEEAGNEAARRAAISMVKNTDWNSVRIAGILVQTGRTENRQIQRITAAGE